MTDRERCPECRYGGGWHAEDCQTHGEPEESGSERFVCPCRVCPRCGFRDESPDRTHPLDGLAHRCFRCGNLEWWSVVGPEFGERCPTSPEELAAWTAYDNAVLAENTNNQKEGES